MMVRIRLFAVARDIAGEDFVDLDFPQAPTVEELLHALAKEVAGLAPVVAHSILVVDEEPAPAGAVIPDGAEVALIPPVSGG